METLREEMAQGQDQYEDLLRHYKRTEERVKREQKENKNHRDKIKELEDLLTEMMEKIGRLPTSTKDLKYRNSDQMQWQSREASYSRAVLRG